MATQEFAEGGIVTPVQAVRISEDGSTWRPIPGIKGATVKMIEPSDFGKRFTKWASGGVSGTLTFTPSPEFFALVTGVSGARDLADAHLSTNQQLACFPGTAAYGRWMGRVLRVGSAYRPASVREERFTRATIEDRGLRLVELSEFPGTYLVCTPMEAAKANLRRVLARFPSLAPPPSGERWHVEAPRQHGKMRTAAEQRKLYERFAAMRSADIETTEEA